MCNFCLCMLIKTSNTFFKQPQFSTNYSFLNKDKTQENNIILFGFTTLLVHLSRVKVHDNFRYGLTITQFLRKKTKNRAALFGGLHINPTLIFHQWKSLCLILQYLSVKKVFVIPFVNSKLKYLATAFSWGTLIQPFSVWRLILTKLNTGASLQNLSQHACVLLLNQTERVLFKNLTLFPSIGVIKPFEEFTPWAGITTLRDDVLLQYFLLTWAWRFLK